MPKLGKGNACLVVYPVDRPTPRMLFWGLSFVLLLHGLIMEDTPYVRLRKGDRILSFELEDLQVSLYPKPKCRSSYVCMGSL